MFAEYELKEVEPYRLYANESFSLDYEHMKLTDLTTQENFDLKCGEVKPGMCGWAF